MMLSVLIVNYNVRYFLEYCLLSVLASARHMQSIQPDWRTEILVIDNGSTDGSVAALSETFPGVVFIDASENLGFGKANNRLLEVAQGRYVLFLNPDTLLPEPCLLEHIRFMERREEIGASGIRMIDGSGNYLPESKRGFPGSWNSFCKMSGLTAAFPGSRIFAGYYEGHLRENESAEVPVLSGAYMLARSQVLKKTGGFDERFFMYAEDIDLSYRINLSGFRTYYFADLSIVHFKGESTNKDAAYVVRFYMAMIQFVQKHYSRGAGLYVLLLKLTIAIKTRRAGGTATAKEQADAFEKLLCLRGDEVQVNKLCARFNGAHLCEMQNPLQRYYLSKDSQVGSGLSTLKENVSGDAKLKSDVVLCLGDNYHFSDLIEDMAKLKNRGIKIFHPHASSIIGSDSKTTKGAVIDLHSCP